MKAGTQERGTEVRCKVAKMNAHAHIVKEHMVSLPVSSLVCRFRHNSQVCSSVCQFRMLKNDQV